MILSRAALLLGSSILILAFALDASAQPARNEFPRGRLRQVQDLPNSRLRDQIERLPAPARDRAVAWLGNIHFSEQDLPSLHVDGAGAVFYADEFKLEGAAAQAATEPVTAAAAVPISPFPQQLVFHSRPGAPNVLYLNFTGETVANTAWNSSLGRTSIPALPFSSDSDSSTFSDSEQAAIRRIWQRVAEDYAPFNIDVTTERPSSFNDRTAHALITPNTDADGNPNPASTSGGVAYVGVFGNRGYSSYRPAWIYANNLGNQESYIAEAASHEIGHNLGLSHDGRTDGAEYYGGHGSGDTSWGPLMGTAYNRNVSQWTKGEYYLASNTQDDLATIAGKLSYRTDDHGNGLASATPLSVLGGTTVQSTTPETDPTNSSPANKGVIERNGDLDMFSFATGAGSISLRVNPWISPSGTVKGGNLDLLVELYDSSGQVLLANNASDRTYALIETTLPEGVYYLSVRNSPAGNPSSSTPSGYTAYGSIGQYFITGSLIASGVIIPPGAELQASNISQAGLGAKQFTVTYSDNAGIEISSVGTGDVLVTGPNGYSQAATLVSVDLLSNGTPRVATYSMTPPGSVWTESDNGAYNVSMEPNQVSDIEGAFVPAQPLGSFAVEVPRSIYFASMDSDPGWTLTHSWQYGAPNYGSGGPAKGYTGNNIVAYNLRGNYENRLSPAHATTPLINTAGSSSLTLRFRRWLRLRKGDTASIQVSTDGSEWTDVWSTTKPVSDNSWEEVQYTLPASALGSGSLQLRWSIASGPAQNEIGWNIDDVELLGDGALDTTPPQATLSIANLTVGGSPRHSCTVTYTDDIAVSLASLDSFDLLVTGPNGYSNLVEFAGADLPGDGTPCTATYAIPAPGAAWDPSGNGVYEIFLLENAVEDTSNNGVAQVNLGSFTVAIASEIPGELAVSPAGDLDFSGPVGGPFVPSSFTCILTNSGGASLNWTARQSASWLTLSSTSGTLAAGTSTTLTVSINTDADDLPAGNYNDSVTFVNETTGNGNTARPISLSITSAGLLAVTSDSDLQASGTEGGPFTPSSQTYTLNNAGGSSLSWTASESASWLTLSSTGGTLAPGATTTVTVSLNTEVDTLPPGAYSSVVAFQNTTALSLQSTGGSADTSRSVTLEVLAEGRLSVLPADDFIAAGHAGGPFLPSEQVYILANHGGAVLDWTVSSPAEWLDFSAEAGTLAPGASTNVIVSIQPDALLSAGVHSSGIAFTESDGSTRSERGVSLTVYDLPNLSATLGASTGELTVAFRGIPGWTYVLEGTTDLQNWVRVGSIRAETDGLIQFPDAEQLNFSRRFYRAFPASVE